MQGLKRKLVYVTCYELIGLSMSTLGLAYLSETQASHTGPLAVMITTIAMLWNLIFNTLFERWESRQAKRGRSVARRVAHAVGFQLTLVVYLIPLIAWWLDMTPVEALLVDMAFIVLIPCYTFAYNWVFDRIFGLPTSAMAKA
ncbi:MULTISPECIES: PACE efflux transporter [Pseudomonas]|uniref:PACE efflux transporter n=1 Tax=Pseudomonas TaxID=286 RepID=UPI0018D9E2CB|nr:MULTISPECIES: PACE efflux transporter [unclassified Pseudomonas]MBH3372818.1 PACE efflux transporter [Pseudomonas juntendi]MBS6036175.1 PACE efflux transporter [Pseudomonas sp.]